DETKNDPAKVRINIPLSLVEVMVPLIEEEAIKDGNITINNKDFSTQELKKLWAAIKDEGDAEFLSVEKRGENVRVFTQGKFLMVQSTKDIEGKVNIRIPLAIVDAMLSGSGDRLNLAAGVKALRDSGVRELVTVESDDAKVLVWIDDKNVAK
ncbi:MAG TPA: hypothetical protein VLH08_16455, partial [Acidobacteriota bacterium]|nr:hypothetical protein [Acidobacteriota bacterium]